MRGEEVGGEARREEKMRGKRTERGEARTRGKETKKEEMRGSYYVIMQFAVLESSCGVNRRWNDSTQRYITAIRRTVRSTRRIDCMLRWPRWELAKC